MNYHTIEQIGPKRSRTSHGFMLCHDVPVARCGLQLYAPGETPITAGAADVVRIERDAEEVFHPDAVASLHGIPIVNEHPTDEWGGRADVTSENWRDLAVGHVLNPRRGEGADDDVLMADLLITDKQAMDLINAGKRELSVGYDAEYEELGPGHGRQRNIRANHLALVERGRCGPRCSIGDEEFTGVTESHTEERGMRTKQMTWADRIRAAFRARDEGELENVLGAAEGGEEGGNAEHHVHVHLPGAPNGAGEENKDQVPPTPAPTVPTNPSPPTPAPDQGEEGRGAATEGDLGTAFKQHVAQNNAEHEELWQAIEALAGQGQGAPNGDSFPAPQRDARRQRDGRDNGLSETEVEDDLGGAPSPSAGGTTVIPSFEMEAPPGTQQNKGTGDSARFQDSFNDTIALAEIIRPGVRLPTFDRAAAPQKTRDCLCDLRTRVLDLAWRDPETREIIEQLTGGQFTSAKNLTRDAVEVLFRAVGAAKARANKAMMSGGASTMFEHGVPASGEIRSPADLQAVLDRHYAR